MKAAAGILSVPPNQTPPKVGLWVNRPGSPYHLNEADVEELFQLFGVVRSIRLTPDKSAAEVIFISPHAANESAVALNGASLSNFGTLSVMRLEPDQNIKDMQLKMHALVKPPIASAPPRTGSYPPHATEPGVGAAPAVASPPAGQQAAPGRPAFPHPQTAAPAGPEPPSSTRYLCRLELIDIFGSEPHFNVTHRICGPKNANIHFILDQSNSAVDIGLKGRPSNASPVAERLHVAVSSCDLEAYRKAVDMTEDLLKSVVQALIDDCRTRNVPPPVTAGVKRHEYREGPGGAMTYIGYKDLRTKAQPPQHHAPPVGQPPAAQQAAHQPPQRASRPPPARPPPGGRQSYHPREPAHPQQQQQQQRHAPMGRR